MWTGIVDSIYIGAVATEPVTSVEQVVAVAGRGLEGDRYFKQKGTFSAELGPDAEITLIEVEAVQALKTEYGLELAPGDIRRNIVTRGAPLNHLVNREFKVGEVMLRGLRLCEPCAHLAGLTHRTVLPGLIHRGGLRAQILAGGTIRVGDEVGEPEEQGGASGE